LLILVVFLGDWVQQIPMAALVAVMVMVSIGTFSWSSVRNLATLPKSSTTVMLATTLVTVFTHDLAQGVLAGVLLSGFFFAHKVSRVMWVGSETGADGRSRRYTVRGQVFFASADAFLASFDFKEVLDAVVIDLSGAHFWDITAVGAVDKVVLKFCREGTTVELIGMNEASTTLMDRYGETDTATAIDHDAAAAAESWHKKAGTP
jgi:SulP family sulfate permease